MKLHKWYHLACWGVPMISLILLLAFKKVGGSVGTPYCQFYNEGGRTWWDWAFVFGPSTLPPQSTRCAYTPCIPPEP
jgi:hypothetical protein